MCEVISNSNVTYKGPSHEAMRSALLDAVKAKVEEGCQSWWEHAIKVIGVCAELGWMDRCTESSIAKLYADVTQRHKILACS